MLPNARVNRCNRRLNEPKEVLLLDSLAIQSRNPIPHRSTSDTVKVMPSTTKKQAHLMSAVAHGWKPTGEKGPSKAVAEEFHSADKKVGKWEHKGKMESMKGRAKTSVEK